MPCDVQVWDEWDFQIIFSCRGTQPIYIQGNTWLSCIKSILCAFWATNALERVWAQLGLSH
jgi:hypothetical protein